MKMLDFLGYDRHGTIVEIETTLRKGQLGTAAITLAALAFNGPAWIVASALPTLYAIAGPAAPLSILLASIFPMLILALCLVRLVREAPSAAGVFTYVERFLHPGMGTILGWTYIVMATAVMPMTANLGAEYIQALVPALSGDIQARVISSLLMIGFLIVSICGVELTARVSGLLLFVELLVVVGLGLCGIAHPQAHNFSWHALYAPSSHGGWLPVAQGIMFGVFMLANFDSAINFIEEARLPVRTVQRSLVLVLAAALVVYTIASIGWQAAVPVEKLGHIVENGDGGAIGAIARIYLPPSFTWIALFVVITSSCANMQMALNSGARTAYRMGRERHLPSVFSRVNSAGSPAISLIAMAAAGVALAWLKPLAQIVWYFDTVTITIVMSYIAMLAACIRMLWLKHGRVAAALLSAAPMVAILVLIYIGYTAGATPADPSDRYNAWYTGAGVIGIGLLLVVVQRERTRRQRAFIARQESRG